MVANVNPVCPSHGKPKTSWFVSVQGMKSRITLLIISIEPSHDKRTCHAYLGHWRAHQWPINDTCFHPYIIFYDIFFMGWQASLGSSVFSMAGFTASLFLQLYRTLNTSRRNIWKSWKPLRCQFYRVFTNVFSSKSPPRSSKSRDLGGEVSARGQGREDSVRTTWSGQVGLVLKIFCWCDCKKTTQLWVDDGLCSIFQLHFWSTSVPIVAWLA